MVIFTMKVNFYKSRFLHMTQAFSWGELLFLVPAAIALILQPPRLKLLVIKFTVHHRYRNPPTGSPFRDQASFLLDPSVH